MDLITHRSTIGYIFIIAGSVISALSKRQYSITLFSTEAEYVVCYQVTKEAVWLQLLLKELDHSQPSPTILSYDNNNTILLTNNPEFHAKIKHINTQIHWIRGIVKAGQIILKWIPGTE